MKFKRLLHEGEQAPLWYGSIGRTHEHPFNQVLYPIPFNWLYRWFWWLYCKTMARAADKWERAIRGAYNEGFTAGCKWERAKRIMRELEPEKEGR